MLRPGGRRRRRRPSGRRRALRWLPLVLLIGAVVGIALGSVADVSARSASYRSATDRGYAALATQIVEASNRTGKALATLMTEAPTLPNQNVPRTARGRIQQGLDDAVSATTAEASQAEAIASPPPSGTMAAQLSAVLAGRADATELLRSTIDGLLGMTPLLGAGSPSPPSSVPNGALLSPTGASVGMGRAGTLFQQADARYRALLADIRRHRYPVQLPASVWVPDPQSSAPLGSVQLAATAPALGGSAALVPFHQLVLTAVGLDPPAVPPPPGSAGAGPGVIGVSCASPQSVLPGPSPTELPPTSALTVWATVTNCGTVAESEITVTASATLADPPGTAAAPAAARGGTRRTRVTLRSGGSVALALGPLPVGGGHRYLVTASIAIPTAQQSQPQGSTQQSQPQGSTQQFLVEITG